MALEAAFENLYRDLRIFRDILQGLRMTVTEDRPERDAVVLVDEVSDAVTELVGLAEESLDAAEEARKAGGPSFDPNHMRRSLARSQKQFHHLVQILVFDLLSYDRIGALVQFGRERGPAWMAWVNSVRQGLDRCRPALEAVGEAYFQCWQEIAERVTTAPVSLHTTNIGQHITTEALESREEREGIT